MGIGNYMHKARLITNHKSQACAQTQYGPSRFESGLPKSKYRGRTTPQKDPCWAPKCRASVYSSWFVTQRRRASASRHDLSFYFNIKNTSSLIHYKLEHFLAFELRLTYSM